MTLSDILRKLAREYELDHNKKGSPVLIMLLRDAADELDKSHANRN